MAWAENVLGFRGNDIKVKVFKRESIFDLEIDLNSWLSKRDVKVTSVKYQTNDNHYTALVVYEKGDE